MLDPVHTPDALAELSRQITRLADAIDGAAITPEGLSPTEAAKFLGISPSKFHTLDAAGLIPSAIEIGAGRCPRYSRSELKAFLLAGAPSRVVWKQMRESAMRKIA